MARILVNNFEEQLQWFRRDHQPPKVPTSATAFHDSGIQYSFAKAEDIQKLLLETRSPLDEFGKFLANRPRLIHQQSQQALLPPPPPVHIPKATPIPPPPVVTQIPASAPKLQSVARQSSTTHQESKSIPLPFDDIPDSALLDIDLDLLVEQATSSSLASVQVESTRNFASAPTPITANRLVTTSHSKVFEEAQPKGPKLCLCQLPSAVGTLNSHSTGNASQPLRQRQVFYCSRLTCSFLEWIPEGVAQYDSSSGNMNSSLMYPPLESNQSINNRPNNNNAFSSSTNYTTNITSSTNQFQSGSYDDRAQDLGISYEEKQSDYQYAPSKGPQPFPQQCNQQESYSTASYQTTMPQRDSSFANNNMYGVNNPPEFGYQINGGGVSRYEENTYAQQSNNCISYSNNYAANSYDTGSSTVTYANTTMSVSPFVGAPIISNGTAITPLRDPQVEIQKRFGHRSFRLGQWDCISQSLLYRKDVFCLMPTGGGKSIVYQLPAWCAVGISVVFSPLISLIQDQVDALNAIGIRAVCLSSSSAGNGGGGNGGDYETSEARFLLQELRSYRSLPAEMDIHEQRRVDESRIKLLYITPEKFSKSTAIRNLLQQLMQFKLLSRFVLDEAHCLSQWGHDFRPDYLRLTEIRQLCPSVPIMALTATANQSVVQDIIKCLHLQAPFVHTQSFNRPNLTYKVMFKKGEKQTLEEIATYIVAHVQQTGIIYCLSRRDCETLVEDLIAHKPVLKGKLSFYHAELSLQEKEHRQRQWFKGEIRVLCATIAFGMGINKPDVRYVIHLHMPKSLTNYYQESGRAGRDGLPAECLLYYSYKDKSRVLSMLDRASQTNHNSNNADGSNRQLDALLTCLSFCLDEVTCRRQWILGYFGEQFNGRKLCKNTCDNCQQLSVLQRNLEVNGLSIARHLIETHDITHIGYLAVQLVLQTQGGQGNANNFQNHNSRNKYGRNHNSNNYNNSGGGGTLPKLTVSKLSKILGGAKGKEFSAYLPAYTEVKSQVSDHIRSLPTPHHLSINIELYHSVPTQYNKERLEAICQRLVISGVLREEHVVTSAVNNYGADYLTIGPKAYTLLNGKEQVTVQFRGSLPSGANGGGGGGSNKHGNIIHNSIGHNVEYEAGGAAAQQGAQHNNDPVELEFEAHEEHYDNGQENVVHGHNGTVRAPATVKRTKKDSATVENNQSPAAVKKTRKRKSPLQATEEERHFRGQEEEAEEYVGNYSTKLRQPPQQQKKPSKYSFLESEDEVDDDFSPFRDKNIGSSTAMNHSGAMEVANNVSIDRNVSGKRQRTSVEQSGHLLVKVPQQVVDLLEDSEGDEEFAASGKYRSETVVKTSVPLDKSKSAQKTQSSSLSFTYAGDDDNAAYYDNYQGNVGNEDFRADSFDGDEDNHFGATPSHHLGTGIKRATSTKKRSASLSSSGAPQYSDEDEMVAVDSDEEAERLAREIFPKTPTKSRLLHSKSQLAQSTQQSKSLGMGLGLIRKPFKSPHATATSSSGSQKHSSGSTVMAVDSDSELDSDRLSPSGLTSGQEQLLTQWLSAYRTRYLHYWHHLSDSSLQYIVHEMIPNNLEELADVPGIGESKANRDGPELLATIYSFLKTHRLFPDMSPDTDITVNAEDPQGHHLRFVGLKHFVEETLLKKQQSGVEVEPGSDRWHIWHNPLSDEAQAAMLRLQQPQALPTMPSAARSSVLPNSISNISTAGNFASTFNVAPVAGNSTANSNPTVSSAIGNGDGTNKVPIGNSNAPAPVDVKHDGDMDDDFDFEQVLDHYSAFTADLRKS